MTHNKNNVRTVSNGLIIASSRTLVQLTSIYPKCTTVCNEMNPTPMTNAKALPTFFIAYPLQYPTIEPNDNSVNNGFNFSNACSTGSSLLFLISTIFSFQNACNKNVLNFQSRGQRFGTNDKPRDLLIYLQSSRHKRQQNEVCVCFGWALGEAKFVLVCMCCKLERQPPLATLELDDPKMTTLFLGKVMRRQLLDVPVVVIKYR